MHHERFVYFDVLAILDERLVTTFCEPDMRAFWRTIILMTGEVMVRSQK